MHSFFTDARTVRPYNCFRNSFIVANISHLRRDCHLLTIYEHYPSILQYITDIQSL